MSVSVTTDVFCDDCGNWVYGVTTGSRAAAREARQTAAAMGWCRTRRNGVLVDLCPSCAETRPTPDPKETP